MLSLAAVEANSEVEADSEIDTDSDTDKLSDCLIDWLSLKDCDCAIDEDISLDSKPTGVSVSVASLSAGPSTTSVVIVSTTKTSPCVVAPWLESVVASVVSSA
ncbi:hypothetical protein [Streptococcus halotolerans]|uniref:hypothetical protein n=1 Tax=Streptococcus halotolerans TaxID=1814128 RepID=UPI0007878BFB|nr:hypothetical protein [Streptococcus halotolerans]